MTKEKKVVLAPQQIVLYKDTETIIDLYAKARSISFEKAAAILTLNEIRCVHSHLDSLICTAHKEAVHEPK